MADFIEIATSFPALPWTVALAVSVVFWAASSLLGGLDADAEFKVDAAADGGVLSTVSDALGLGHAPVGVIVAAWSAVGWLLTMVTMSVLGPGTHAVVGLVVLLLSIVAAAAVAGRVARWVAPLFAPNRGIDRDALVGKICTVRTGRVDASFGQAEVADADGAVHLITVRCARPNELTSGSQALVVTADDGVFHIDPDIPWLGQA